MDSILGVIGVFAIRLGIPILVMVLLSWGVSRVVSREEARAEAQAEVKARVEPAISPSRVPQKQCWEIKGCSQAAMAKCPAVRRPDLPCWLARQLAAGKASAACPSCAIFKATVPAPGHERLVT